MRLKLLKFYLLATLIGCITGFVCCLFRLSINWLDALMQVYLQFVAAKGWPTAWISALLTMVMVLFAWLGVRYIAPEAAGSGIPEIQGALHHVRPIYWRRLLPVKFFAGILALASKMVVGREGPCVQMGGNLAEMIGNCFGLTRYRRDVLIAAGAAAGLATAFNAPLAGVLFITEGMRKQFIYSFTNFKVVLISAVAATIILHYMIGGQAAISMPIYDLPSLKSMVLFFIFGIVVGIFGLAYNKGVIASLRLVDIIPPHFKVVYVLCVAFGVGYLAYTYPPVVGAGYEIISHTLITPPSLIMLSFWIVARYFIGFLCYSTRIPGGVFAPMLALGALLGLVAFHFLRLLEVDFTIQPDMFAVAGMGALFAATVRSPITGVVLVVEMTQNYSLILPLMITCITSTTFMQLVRNKPIYLQLLIRTVTLQRMQHNEGT